MKPDTHSHVRIRMRIAVIVLTVSSVSFYSCDTQQNVSRQRMQSLMQSFQAAAEERSADKIMILCQRSPGFLVYLDGKALNYDEFVHAGREVFHRFKNIQLKWDTIHVRVLGADVVAALTPFRGVLTDSNGLDTRLKGEVTWTANRIAGAWKLVYAHYAHAWYQPETISRQRRSFEN